jgi:hypothetical protein
MSLYDYEVSRTIGAEAPFYALIMAAMHRADTANLAMLQDAWPEVWVTTYLTHLGRADEPLAWT